MTCQNIHSFVCLVSASEQPSGQNYIIEISTMEKLLKQFEVLQREVVIEKEQKTFIAKLVF